MKRSLLKIFSGLSNIIFLIFPRKYRILLKSYLYEHFDLTYTIKTRYGSIDYFSPSIITWRRAVTFYTKEPETLEWIDAMSDQATLWDVGANVGMYSIYAAKKGLKVYSFEPSVHNCYVLAKNIEVNCLEDVRIFCLAISDKHSFGYFSMSTTELGGAISEFSEQGQISTLQCGNYEKKLAFTEGMFAYSIDELVYEKGFICPDYIKIDVDSIEEKIIYGAERALEEGCVKSILVELNDKLEESKNVTEFLKQRGFSLKLKKHSPMFNEGAFANIYNYIFVNDRLEP